MGTGLTYPYPYPKNGKVDRNPIYEKYPEKCDPGMGSKD